jgi:hypothetical protein
MSWIDPTEYNETDLCSICQDVLGNVQAIYKTACNHKFHNDCLDAYCESKHGQIKCPSCRADVGEDTCLSVSAFKEHTLGNPQGTPLFHGNQHVLDIYNGNVHGGKRRKTKRKGKRRKTRIRK